MITISDRDRAEAQEMAEAFHGGALAAPSNNVRQWLAVRDHVLATHECPSTDRRPLGHYRHPRMDGQTECPECGYPMHEHGWLDCGGDGIVVCPSLHGPFGGQAVTDHARNHTCPTVPVWRPTTADEIQPGWEVRSRHRDGAEAKWGVAHVRDSDGDWWTEAEARLTYTYIGWMYETTAPLPEPEPDDFTCCAQPATIDPALLMLPTVEEVADVLRSGDGLCFYSDSARAILDLIADRVPVWQPVQPGTVIKAGTRVREGWDGQIAEWTLDEELIMDPQRRYWFDPRTIPAAPEPWDEALVGALADAMRTTTGGTTWEDDARAVLDLLADRGLIERPKAGA